MKAPRHRGEPVDMARVRDWVEEFAGYRIAVNEGRIERWLQQFAESDRDLAARLLDVVDFVGNDQIAAAFRATLSGLSGWSPDESKRSGRWFFVAFSSSAGESGDQMLHRFRTANNLGGRRYDSLFHYRSELVILAPSEEDTVVLIDDFAGTGNQACQAWDQVYRELLPLGPRIYLILVASSKDARERIRKETEMTLQAHIELGDGDNVFSSACRHFTSKEKENILRYCEKADPSSPRGYGECGFMIVLSHKCPNNSLPVLHARRRSWEGLFRRHD
jgi:hypothetical protein